MKQKSPKSGNSGFALYELLIGAALATIALKGAMHGFILFNKTGLAMNQTMEKELENERLFFHLRTYMSGVRGFQNLNFRVPDKIFGGGPAQSAGTGFYVFPKVDINGNTNSNFDMFTMVVDDPMVGGSWKLAKEIIPGDTTIDIEEAADPGAPKTSNKTLRNGDVLILSDTQKSEALLLSNLPSAATTIGPNKKRYSINSNWLKSTFKTGVGPASLENRYSQGDTVYRAKIIQIGIEPASKCLVLKERGAEVYRNCKVKEFKALYKADAAKCGGTLPVGVGTDFERLAWSVLNKGDYQGYRCISQIRFDLTIQESKALVKKSWMARTNN